MDVAAIARQGGVEVRVNGEMRVAADKVVAGEDFLRTCHTLMVVAVCFLIRFLVCRY